MAWVMNFIATSWVLNQKKKKKFPGAMPRPNAQSTTPPPTYPDCKHSIPSVWETAALYLIGLFSWLLTYGWQKKKKKIQLHAFCCGYLLSARREQTIIIIQYFLFAIIKILLYSQEYSVCSTTPGIIITNYMMLTHQYGKQNFFMYSIYIYNTV